MPKNPDEAAKAVSLNDKNHSQPTHKTMEDKTLTNIIVDAIRDEVAPVVKKEIMADLKLEELVKEVVAKHTKTIKVQVSKAKPAVNCGAQHAKFQKVLDLVMNDIPVWLVGEAGTGKTHMALHISKALDLPFYPASLNEQVSKAEFTGFEDANGKFHDPFNVYKWAKNGGLMLLDEIDSASPNVLATLNSALSNKFFTFMNGERVVLHKDCRIICSANTMGTGGNRRYAGRNRIDAATIARFAFVEIDYDVQLERAVFGDGGWCAYLQGVRAACREANVDTIVDMRSIKYANVLHDIGIKPPEILEMVVWRGTDKSSRAKVEALSSYKALKLAVK